MSKRIHKNWIHAYLAYSGHSEAPDTFHFWTAISVLAGCLRRKVWLDMKYFQWTPNFYIVFVAPPGIVSKSTTASIGMNLLKRVPSVHFGPDAVTWQSLVQSLAAATESFEYNLEYHPMSAVTIASSEFGNFLNPSDREMVDVMVSLWDGQKGVWEKATKTMGNDKIVNPWINLLACTTPAWIAGNFPEYMIGGGFTSRTIFVYADQKRRLIAYPRDHVPQDFEKMGDDLVHDLEYIANNLCGEYVLSPDATQYGVEWYETHNTETHNLSDERFQGYLARKQTHIHKLAIVLAAAESDELVIERDHLHAATEIITSLEGDMPKIFSQITGETVRAANSVVTLIQKNQGITIEVAYRKMFHTISWTDFQAAVQSATKAGLLTLTKQGDTIIMRTPS